MKKVMVLMAKLLEERTKRFLIPLVIVFLVLLTTSLTYADPVFVFEFETKPPLDAVAGSTYEYDFSVAYNGAGPLSFSVGGDDTFEGDIITASFASSGIYTVNEVPYKSSAILHLRCTDSIDTIEQYATITITNAVPIPSAVWLLSSGFIGLIGIKRKFRKN